MFKNVRGPTTEHVLTYACGKMPGGFADIAGITARTQKLVYHIRTKLTRDRLPSLTVHVPCTLNYLILVLFLLSRKQRFACVNKFLCAGCNACYVSERLLKLHERWKSEEARGMYVLEPQCSRLRVTKYLGI